MHQRRVLARFRCGTSMGYGTRQDSVMRSSVVALAKCSATCLSTVEIDPDRAFPVASMAVRWQAATPRTPPAALEPRRLHLVPWQAFSSSWSSRRRVRCWNALARQLKEHRTFDWSKLFARGLKTNAAGTCPEFSFEERTDGVTSCACAVFLQVSGCMRTFSP